MQQRLATGVANHVAKGTSNNPETPDATMYVSAAVHVEENRVALTLLAQTGLLRHGQR